MFGSGWVLFYFHSLRSERDANNIFSFNWERIHSIGASGTYFLLPRRQTLMVSGFPRTSRSQGKPIPILLNCKFYFSFFWDDSRNCKRDVFLFSIKIREEHCGKKWVFMIVFFSSYVIYFWIGIFVTVKRLEIDDKIWIRVNICNIYYQ